MFCLEVIVVRNSLLTLFSLVAVLVFVPLQPISASESKNAKDLFESKCSLCHSTDTPKSKNKTKKDWETTVMRMKDVNGAPITDEEARMIIDYLAQNYGE
jgi:cytochrome c5